MSDQPRKTLKDVLAVVNGINFRDERFVVLEKGDGFLLQLRYREVDVDDPYSGPKEQHARKWYISPFATRSEIVRTAFLACIVSAEHRVREHFLYEGQRIFSPHLDVNRLRSVMQLDPELLKDHRGGGA